MKKSKKLRSNDLVWTLKIAGLKVQVLAELIGNQANAIDPTNRRDMNWALGLILSSIGEEIEETSRIIEEKQIRKAVAKSRGC